MTDLAPWNVILIDDEPDSLNLISDMLVLNGAQVHRAVSGMDGLALMREITPTLVIMDLSMPKPDGWEVLSQMRAMPGMANVPAVAITAYSSDNVIKRAGQAGFTALIPKPIKLNILLSKLHEIVG